MRFSKSLAVTSIVATLAVTAIPVAPAPVAVAAEQPQTLAAANAAIDSNLDSLNRQAGELGSQVSEVNGLISKLEAERAALLPEKEHKQAVVRETAKQAYMAGESSSVEVVASNSTLSGSVSQQQYRDKISEKTQAAVKDLAETEKKIAANLEEANKKRDGLVALQSDLQVKIDTAQAQAEAKAALAQAAKNEAEFQALKQRQEQESLAVVPSSAPSPSSKPASGGNGGGMVRGNNPYTPGQCTWYVYNQTGRGQMGNAGQWPGGGSRGVGSILIMPPGVGGAGGVGHVGVIVGFSGSGITIRDMNWAGPFVVTTHTVPNSGSYRYL
jgi:surface antigen